MRMKFKFLLFIIVAIGIGSAMVMAQNAEKTKVDTVQQINDSTDLGFSELAKEIFEGRQNILPAKSESKFSLISIVRGIFGLIVLVFIAWLFSSNRKAVNWKVVGVGLGI